MTCAALVVAKAPVPGLVKTRLGADVGLAVAADLAAAGLLDTMDACEAAFGVRHLAVAGDLRGAIRGAELCERTGVWTVHEQRGDGFATRLAHAHADAGDPARPVVQVGMDTPHVTPAGLLAVADALHGHDAVLGPADDGGWWVLALRHPRHAAALRGVEMSTDRTGADTLAALESAGARVALAAPLRDVDTAEDAEAVAALAPGTRFARAWRAARTAGAGEPA